MTEWANQSFDPDFVRDGFPGSKRPGGGHSPYELIRDLILEGKLVSGQQLVEAVLADWCGVSRTPVRGALTRLLHDGLVERGARGLVVRSRSFEEILDIYETRIGMEVSVARLAAERYTEYDRLRVEERLAALERTDPTRHAELFKRNREFHRQLWLCSHSESLVDLLDRLNLHLLRYSETTLAVPGRLKSAFDEHRRMVNAIFRRDGAGAEELAREHFTRARDIRMSTLTGILD